MRNFMLRFILIALLLGGTSSVAAPYAYADNTQPEKSLASFEAYPLASKGYSYIEQRQYDMAQNAFEKAVKLAPSNAEYRLQLASLLMAAEDYQKAHEVIYQGLGLAPNHRGFVTIEAEIRRVLEKQNKHVPALPALTEGDVVAPPYTKQQEVIVEQTLNGQIASSLTKSNCAMLLIESYNSLADGAALNAGYCALDAKENAKAIKLFENASYSKDSAIAVQALNQLGFIYTDKNQHTKAAQYWRKSVAMEPNTGIEINIARAYRLSGELEKAHKALTSIAEGVDTSAENKVAAMRELALMFDEQDNTAEAYEAGEDIIALQPSASDYYYQALRAQRVGEYDQARGYLVQANQMQPDTFIYMYSLAYAYRADGQFEKAANMFEKALSKKDSTDLRLDYAYSLKEIGERKKAAEQFVIVQSQIDDVEKTDPMRREVRDLSREWTTFGSISYRDGVYSGIDSTGSQLYDDSFQYGIETVYSPEKWQRNGRRIQLYGQIFASSDSSTFNWNQDSTQGAVGARITPLRDTEWYLYIARLVSLGDNALDDTQLRTTFSNTDGFEYEATEKDWEYKFFNVDLSY